MVAPPPTKVEQIPVIVQSINTSAASNSATCYSVTNEGRQAIRNLQMVGLVTCFNSGVFVHTVVLA